MIISPKLQPGVMAPPPPSCLQATIKWPYAGQIDRALYSGYLTFKPTVHTAKLVDHMPPPALSVPYLAYSEDWCSLPVLAEPEVFDPVGNQQAYIDSGLRVGCAGRVTIQYGGLIVGQVSWVIAQA